MLWQTLFDLRVINHSDLYPPSAYQPQVDMKAAVQNKKRPYSEVQAALDDDGSAAPTHATTPLPALTMSVLNWEEDVNTNTPDEVQGMIMTVVQLAKYITRNGGVVTGRGANPDHTSIAVSAPKSGRPRTFNIGVNQNLRLVKKRKASTSVADYNNVLDVFSEEPGVFHLLARHADALYSVCELVDEPGWFEVDLHQLACAKCYQPCKLGYVGPKVASRCNKLQCFTFQPTFIFAIRVCGYQ